MADMSEREPRLDRLVEPECPRGAVLFLHGGQERSTEPVQDKHASWWRIWLMARGLRDFAERERLAVDVLQYRARGWNDPASPSPVSDARWALERVRERSPGVPIVLVGHSMGGRTSCRVADDPNVIGVVGLAPWLPEGEPRHAVEGRHLRVIHGTRDRWTSARLSREFVERSRPIAASASWTSLPGAGHFMFRRVPVWNGFVKDSVTDILRSAASGEEAATHPGRPGHE